MNIEILTVPPKNAFTVQSAYFAGSAESFQTFVYLFFVIKTQDCRRKKLFPRSKIKREKIKKSGNQKDLALFSLFWKVSIQNLSQKLGENRNQFPKVWQSQNWNKKNKKKPDSKYLPKSFLKRKNPNLSGKPNVFF